MPLLLGVEPTARQNLGHVWFLRRLHL